jgi:ribosomal protein S27AE
MDPSMAEMIQTTTNMMGNMIWLMVVMLLIGITISVLTRIINEPVPPTPSPVVKPKKYVKKPVVRYDDVAEYKCPYCGTVRIMDEHADHLDKYCVGCGSPCSYEDENIILGKIPRRLDYEMVPMPEPLPASTSASQPYYNVPAGNAAEVLKALQEDPQVRG